MKNKILYIGNFNFPNGNAAGKRVFSNAKILKKINYEVLIVDLKNINYTGYLDSTQSKLKGFDCYSFSYPKSNLDWLKYRKTFRQLTKFIEKKNIIDELKYVIYYGSPRISLFNWLLINFCKKNEIKVISDCVDWLSVNTNNFFYNIFKWIDTTYQKAFLNKKVDGLIVISDYLDDYYKNYNINTVKVPPLSPKEYKLKLKSKYIKTNRKLISYAGLPFRKNIKVSDKSNMKDRIDKIIKLLYLAKKENASFIFNIYGFTKEEFLIALPDQRKYIEFLGDSIKFNGYTENEIVTKKIMNSDFTILIRDIKRSTTAGFPTKVSESISLGTPVITNKTSDLEKYIIDGVNGFFINNDIEDSLNKIIDILKTEKNEIIKIKEKTIESNPFYYKKYESKMGDFLNKI